MKLSLFMRIIINESGRVILFDIGDTTFGNVYLPSGTDGVIRARREHFCGEVIPSLMINSMQSGIICRDWSNIIRGVSKMGSTSMGS